MVRFDLQRPRSYGIIRAKPPGANGSESTRLAQEIVDNDPIGHNDRSRIHSNFSMVIGPMLN